MKIAINAIRVSRKAGGGLDHYIINLVNQLAKSGLEFDLFTVAPHHFEQVNPKRIKNPFIIFGDLPRLIWTQILFPFYLIFGQYDLVFSPSQIDALPFSPVKQVMTVLDLIPFILTEQKHKHLLFLKTLFPMALKKGPQIIAISENTKRDLIRLFSVPENNVTVIPLANPVGRLFPNDTVLIKKKYNLDRYIFCLSNNDPHKNLARLIEAFSLIKDRSHCHLMIAGYQNPAHQEKLDRLVLEKKIGNRVRFLGHVSDEELQTLYRECEIFVYPSLYEGFGLPPLEALSYGVPTIVSRSSSLPEVVGEAGLYFDPQSVQDMGEKMLQLLMDEKLKAKLRDLGVKQAQLFSWEKTASETIRVFHRMIRLNEK